MKNRLIEMVLFVSLSSFSLSLPCLTHAHATARITGTIFQLNEQHAEWNQNEWQHLIYKFKKLGLNNIVIQWIIYDYLDFSTLLSKDKKNTVLDQILQSCTYYKMDVYVGLIYDPDYWRKIEQDIDAQLDYLKEHYNKTITLAKRLHPDLIKWKVFKGWYISEEIDDINWQKLNSAEVLHSYLLNLSITLKKLSPQKNILISGFSNAAQNPREIENFWNFLLFQTKIDKLLFQDGVGAHKLNLKQLPEYFSAVRNAAHLHGVEFQVITEIFEQTGGVPIDNGPFQAQPAPQQRIRKQLHIAGDFTPTVIVFSVPEYMSSLEGLQTSK